MAVRTAMVRSGRAPRGSSMRCIRIGGGQQRSLLTSLAWAAVLGTLLALFIFVALPAIVMVVVGVFVLRRSVSLLGRGTHPVMVRASAVWAVSTGETRSIAKKD